VQLLLACIAGKAYKAALPLLDCFVYLIDPTQTGISSEDTRLYYYYGGICYAALKKWEKAIHFFEIVCNVCCDYVLRKDLFFYCSILNLG
jgi:COP9 signalosome complex subunit 3